MATNVSLRDLIGVGFLNLQIVGGPSWIGSDRFDVMAKAAAELSRDEMRMMLRRLLVDRFRLLVHGEVRELAVYALVIARTDKRLGPQLRRSLVDCAGAATGAQALPSLPPPSGRLMCDRFDSALGPRFLAGGVTMAQLAMRLSPWVNRIVLDRTGLDGTFDFEVQWTLENLPPRAPGTPADQPVRLNGTDIDPTGPSIFTALAEQLGLKLISQKGPVDVLVIDSASQPTPDY